MFSEVTEVRDAIHLLTARAANEEVARDLIREMAWYDEYLERGAVDRSANPTPGNKTRRADEHRGEGAGLDCESRDQRDRWRLRPGRTRHGEGACLRRDPGERFHLRNAAAGCRR